jgi:quercetin dioxygenase-like cupin family protein
MRYQLLGAVAVFAAGSLFTSRPARVSPAGPQAGAKPLLLEAGDGERLVWRDPPPGGFTIKVSPLNNGSEHLVLLTEDMAPGDAIPRHKHLGQDEIVLIQKGTVHVHLGDQERDLHDGGLVFIPAYTWVSLKNVGAGTASIIAVFSAPGFENHLRCVAVPVGQAVTPTTPEEEKRCDRLGHVLYADPGDTLSAK